MSDERTARRVLLHAAEPGDPVLQRFVAAHGPTEAVRLLLGGTDPSKDGRLAARVRAADLAREAARADQVGARLVCPGDEEWPGDRLAGLAVPPYALWVRGSASLAAVVDRSVAVVGSRASTAYGEHVATELASGLADEGWTVVSGAAYGIDGAAHRGSMAVGGDTLAVLAGGVDDAYPRGHASLLERIAGSGLVVSELPLLDHPNRSRFLERNRIIAALSRGVVAVEMAPRSGAASTLEHAQRLLRVVMAVPGPVTSLASRGCHAWIRDRRAELVGDAADVLRLVEPVGARAEDGGRGPERSTDALGADALAVFDALPPSGSLPLADLPDAVRLPAPTVGDALRELVLLDLVVVSDEGVHRAAPRGGP